MNVRALMDAVNMQVALTQLETTHVSVVRDSLEMDSLVKVSNINLSIFTFLTIKKI